MFCSNCGKELPNGSVFCSGCGKKQLSSPDSYKKQFNDEINQMYELAGNNSMLKAGVKLTEKVGMRFVPENGMQKPIDDAIYSIEGVRGKHLDVYENKCVIKTRITIGSVITKNATDGEKTIYYKDCIGVQFREQGKVLIGYLQFETASSSMNNRHDNFWNENTFTYDTTKVSNETMRKVANYVKQRIEEIKSESDKPTQIISQISVADELKKFKELLDLEVITQEEFDLKKKELLGM